MRLGLESVIAGVVTTGGLGSIQYFWKHCLDPEMSPAMYSTALFGGIFMGISYYVEKKKNNEG